MVYLLHSCVDGTESTSPSNTITAVNNNWFHEAALLDVEAVNLCYEV
jgi:hypothetical protein